MPRLHSNILPFSKPRSFTKAERVVEYFAEQLITDPRGYKAIAQDMGLSASTVGNIASRKTKWPRPTTFFAILSHYQIDLDLKKK